MLDELTHRECELAHLHAAGLQACQIEKIINE